MRIQTGIILFFFYSCNCVYESVAVADFWRSQSFIHSDSGIRFQHALQVASTGDVYVLDQWNIMYRCNSTDTAPIRLSFAPGQPNPTSTTERPFTQQIFLTLTDRPDIFLCSRAACGVASLKPQNALWHWNPINQSVLNDIFMGTTSQVMAAYYQHDGMTQIYTTSQQDDGNNGYIMNQVFYGSADFAVLKQGPRSGVLGSVRTKHHIQPVFLHVMAGGSDQRTGFGNGYLLSLQNRTTTRLGRFCAGSNSFRSYTEITLQCRRNNHLYTVATEASLLEDENGESFLAVSFGRTASGNVQQSDTAVLCVYALKEVNQLFDREIELCYSEGSRTQLEWLVGVEKPCRKDRTNATKSPTFPNYFCINKLEPELNYTSQQRNGFISGKKVLAKTAMDWFDAPILGVKLVNSPLTGASRVLTGMFMVDGVLYLKDQLNSAGNKSARTLAQTKLNSFTTLSPINPFVFGNGSLYALLQGNRVEVISVGCGMHRDACACQANYNSTLNCGWCSVVGPAMNVCASSDQCDAYAGHWSNSNLNICMRESFTGELLTGDQSIGQRLIGPLTVAVLFVIVYGIACYHRQNYWMRKLLCLCLFSRSSRRSRNMQVVNVSKRTVPGLGGMETEELPMRPITTQYAVLMEVSIDSLELGDEIGRGQFGVVYRGRAKTLPTRIKVPLEVAVKCLSNAWNQDEFDRECRIMAKTRPHVNIVNLLGVVPTAHYLLLEYCRYGNLLNYLREFWPQQVERLQYSILDDLGNLPHCMPAEEKLQRRATNEPLGSVHMRLCTHDLVKFCHQISRGMEYLVSCSIIHRDLAARNVLVADERVLKISDFGLAKHGGHEYLGTRPSAHLPIRWMSPEAILNLKFSHKSDVWSFGILMWEIFSLGLIPFNTVEVAKFSARAFADWLVNNINHMEIPTGTPVEIQQLMRNCWSLGAFERQDFAHHEARLWQLVISTTTEADYLFDADLLDIPVQYQALLEMRD